MSELTWAISHSFLWRVRVRLGLDMQVDDMLVSMWHSWIRWGHHYEYTIMPLHVSYCIVFLPLPVLVKYVAICVRVGRQCHQSGGTDVVDLPDILLPEDQYLDMFDSESDISGDNSEDELVEVL